jgi:hypothetical protein
LIAISSLPLFSFIFARILANVEPRRELLRVPKDNETGSRSSRARNFGVSGSELAKKKDAPKARVRSPIPTNAEHEKLKKAYRGMLLRKEKITNEALAKKAGIRKAVAGWWRKNTDLETIAGTDMVPAGKPKLSIVD